MAAPNYFIPQYFTMLRSLCESRPVKLILEHYQQHILYSIPLFHTVRYQTHTQQLTVIYDFVLQHTKQYIDIVPAGIYNYVIWRIEIYYLLSIENSDIHKVFQNLKLSTLLKLSRQLANIKSPFVACLGWSCREYRQQSHLPLLDSSWRVLSISTCGFNQNPDL